MSFFGAFSRGTPSKTAAVPGTAGKADGAAVTSADSPLELISYNTQTGKFHVGEAAVQVLRKIPGPVGVVAVSGRARQGKSFILNQLLGQSTGFVVAPTHRPCTKGLWMWSKPIERLNADGSRYHLVLLDTEGIDAYDQTGQYSTQIFSLAVLLSSLFVYNQMGAIDEAAIDRLSLVTEMTKRIRVRAGSSAAEGAQQETELSDFTPAFLWLLRDSYLTLEEDGRQITPREYLETALRSVEGSGPAVESKNKIRKSIKTLFPNRDCFTLVRPMNNESQLTKLESIPPSQMRPEFVDGIQRLTKLIFQRAQPKRLGNQIVSGSMLAALALAYVDAINLGAVPTIATAWQGVAEAECRRAADAAEAAYVAAFKDVTTDEAALDAEHQHSMAAARDAYAAGAMGDEAVKKANEQRFTERLDNRFAQLKQQRLASAESECRKMISDITARLTQIASQDSATLGRLQQELQEWDAAYNSAPSASGPAKWRLHADFMQNTWASISAGVAQRQEQAAKAERLAAADKARDFDRRLTQEASKAAELERRLAAEHAETGEVQRRLQQAEARVADLQQQLQAATQSQAASQDRAAKEAQTQISRIRAEHAKQVAELTRQLEQANAHRSSVDSAASQRVRDLEAQLTRMQSDGQRLRQQAEAAGAQTAAARSENQQQAHQLEHNRSEIASIQGRLDAAIAQLADANRARQDAAAQLAQLQAQLASTPARAAAGPEDIEEGYGTPEEDNNLQLTPEKMTINQIKDWLTEHGHENVVWDLTLAKAKKPRYVQEMNDVLGRT